MRLHRLDAAVFELAPQADAFVQAYTTQTPAASRGAFLDVKGRAIAVYDRFGIDADRSVFVVARAVRDRLHRHLKPYLLLTGTAWRDLPHSAYWNLDEDLPPSDGSWVIRRSAGRILVTTETLAAPVDEEAFRRFRWKHRLPLQGIDYDDPMLLNLNDPELVSFAKGCYLGQEIMARVHYRGKPPLRLAAVRESECSPDLVKTITSRVKDPDSGEWSGFAFLPAS